MTQLTELADYYYKSRGISKPKITHGHKVVEEGNELVEAIAKGELLHIYHEIADVILAATAVAQKYNVSPEHCIALKTELDRGRNVKSK